MKKVIDKISSVCGEFTAYIYEDTEREYNLGYTIEDMEEDPIEDACGCYFNTLEAAQTSARSELERMSESRVVCDGNPRNSVLFPDSKLIWVQAPVTIDYGHGDCYQELSSLLDLRSNIQRHVNDAYSITSAPSVDEIVSFDLEEYDWRQIQDLLYLGYRVWEISTQTDGSLTAVQSPRLRYMKATAEPAKLLSALYAAIDEQFAAEMDCRLKHPQLFPSDGDPSGSK